MPVSQHHPALTPEAQKMGLDRIIFFSDAVIAIAMTLMALEIHVPETVDAQHLHQALIDLLPTVQTYLLSFLVTALYWIEHHRMFRYVRRYDGGLIWLNLLFLILIVLVPFPTDLVDRFGDHDPLVVTLYAALLTLTGLSVALMWWYATHRRRLVDPDLDPALVRHILLVRLSVPAVFLITIPIAWLSPVVAEYCWMAVFPLTLAWHLLW